LKAFVASQNQKSDVIDVLMALGEAFHRKSFIVATKGLSCFSQIQSSHGIEISIPN
jgi:hypothetical protein